MRKLIAITVLAAVTKQNFSHLLHKHGALTNAQTAIPVAVGCLAAVAAPVAVLASQFIINKGGDANNIVVQHNDQLANNDA
ncbi:hypothetical protein [Cytobacillus purgationiresistens]|uniref:Uncharacterized protein n=1 Tax=Cytobacillus purgationiresistens TaxID=863449 RepID=A0ABU0AJ87_9BACI|nr:hypothetical protein [Cytobacillus purgationiresistens]MDQ0270140.1 hypothetical protein [Cytobacillus purgationiresistens]